MKIKKKIIRQSFNYNEEKSYYREAKICPNCGNKEDITSGEYLSALSSNTLTIHEGLTRTGDRCYECYKCGCQWEVPSYKG